MDNLLTGYNTTINTVLTPLMQPTVLGLLRAFLILYGSLAAPHLPNSILQWFDYVPFRIAILAAIPFVANVDPAIAVLLAIAFYTSINTLNGKKPFEKLTI